MTTSGTITYTDVDTTDTHAFSLAGARAEKSTDSVYTSDGSSSDTAIDSAAVDALGAGETLADSFTVKVADNHGGSTTQLVRSEERRVGEEPVTNGATKVASDSV